MIKVTIWNEYEHEKNNPKAAELYPRGIHQAIAEGLSDQPFAIRTATLDEPEHGLTEEVLNDTDVLIWWGHKAHDKVETDIFSWFEGGEVFRSGCTYHRGQGKIFYFRPGHETYPTYYNENVPKVISNGVKWAAPRQTARLLYGKSEPLELISAK